MRSVVKLAVLTAMVLLAMMSSFQLSLLYISEDSTVHNIYCFWVIHCSELCGLVYFSVSTGHSEDTVCYTVVVSLQWTHKFIHYN
jgi:hypothetical protein